MRRESKRFLFDIDEAITTPTPDSVRRAVAIHSYQQFERISGRGGLQIVIPARRRRRREPGPTLWPRGSSRIPTGSLPIVGVNTFLPPEGEGE